MKLMDDKRELPDHFTEQQQRILAAASELLGEHGADGLRVRDIAAAADCSTMGVYSHFGGKNGLVEAIFVDGFRRFESALRAAMRGRSAGRMKRVGLAYRHWAFANPGSYAVMFAGVVPGFEPGDAALGVALEGYQVLLECVAAEQDMGRMSKASTDTVAYTLWGLVHGLVMIEFAGMAPPDSVHGDAAFSAAVAAAARGYD